MARPSLFVRPLEQGEMEFLAHLRKSRRQALRQRAEILLASVVYTPVSQIALIFRTDEAFVRKVIHAFNEHGFESLNPKVAALERRKEDYYVQLLHERGTHAFASSTTQSTLEEAAR